MKDRDQFEDLLGESLAEFREAEPRAGLAGRVLAGVEADAKRPRIAWWNWIAVAAAAMLFVALFVGRGREKAPVAVRQVAPVEKPVPKPEVAVEKAPAKREAVRPVRRVVPKQEPVATTVAIVTPPPPMTAQEKALMAMAQGAPAAFGRVPKEGQETKDGRLPEIPAIEIKPLEGAQDGGQQ